MGAYINKAKLQINLTSHTIITLSAYEKNTLLIYTGGYSAQCSVCQTADLPSISSQDLCLQALAALLSATPVSFCTTAG